MVQIKGSFDSNFFLWELDQLIFNLQTFFSCKQDCVPLSIYIQDLFAEACFHLHARGDLPYQCGFVLGALRMILWLGVSNVEAS